MWMVACLSHFKGTEVIKDTISSCNNLLSQANLEHAHLIDLYLDSVDDKATLL